MPLTTEEKRARRREYMRTYRRKKPSRQAEGRSYWERNKKQIIARRKAIAKALTGEQLEQQRARSRGYAKRWRDENREKFRETQNRHKRKFRDRNNKKRKEEILLALEAEAGRPRPSRCEVCGEGGVITFDHCHQRGVFRGWICTSCNKALGFVKDDPNRLRKLIAYLERTKKIISPQMELPV